MANLTDIFNRLVKDQRWFTPTPFTDEEIEKIAQDNNLHIPPTVRELMRHVAGGEWSGKKHVQFFDDLAIADVQPSLHPQLQGTFAFASDGGSKWYLLDFSNRLGRGEDAVWVVYAASPYSEDARFIAGDLDAFLEWMMDDD